jgi:hypothetical protein
VRGLELFLVFFGRLIGTNRLVFKRLGLLVVKDLFGAWRKRLTGVLELVVGFDGEAEVLGAVAPIENVGLPGRIVPVDNALRRLVGENSSVLGRPRLAILC